MGAQSTKTFTVTAKVSTGSPEDTDVSWSLSPSHPDCYMFEYGDMGYVGGTTFSDDFVLSRADLSGNVCAGAWTLEAHAFDFGASPGSDDYERVVYFKRRSGISNNNAGPEPVSKDGTVTVSADLKRVSWNNFRYYGMAGARAELQFRAAGESYETVKTVTADDSGRLRTSIRQYVDGCYRWVFRGYSTTAAAVSAGDCVDAR